MKKVPVTVFVDPTVENLVRIKPFVSPEGELLHAPQPIVEVVSQDGSFDGGGQDDEPDDTTGLKR